MKIEVSVVVPTYRRRALLLRCLEALADQDIGPAALEVIVADDEASPQTEYLVRKLDERSAVVLRYIAVSGNHGPAAARNAGWRAAAGTVVAFTDDDCIPQRGWVRGGLDSLARGADAAAGEVRVPLPAQPTDYQRDMAGLATAEFVTANCFCRRAALEAVGGFDERFTIAWREDSDLHFSLLEKGYTVTRAAGAVVVHPVRPARWGVSLARQRNNAVNALLYKKHPALYRQRIRRMPWQYYATALALAAMAAGMAAGQPSTVWAGAAVWTWLTGWFCWRRLRHTSRTAGHVAEMLVTSALIPPWSLYWHLRGAVRHRAFFV